MLLRQMSPVSKALILQITGGSFRNLSRKPHETETKQRGQSGADNSRRGPKGEVGNPGLPIHVHRVCVDFIHRVGPEQTGRKVGTESLGTRVRMGGEVRLERRVHQEVKELKETQVPQVLLVHSLVELWACALSAQ
ncbi:hypothetical protein INR49_020539 [Caranx melampygus]|nr:hypothetical protein INR49_020539 [Caranx melampygus]